MFIVACGIARFDTMISICSFGIVSQYMLAASFEPKQLSDAIDKKMKINRKRKWNFQDGLYQHKED